MDYVTYSHRHAGTLFECETPYVTLWREIQDVLRSISDSDLIDIYSSRYFGKMSISGAINDLIKERLVHSGWSSESPIFADPKYRNARETRWRLDFAKDEVSVEVAFNHAEASAWNLLKPVLASELNHVEKAIQTSAGILICATEEMKTAGAFDGAVGTFESFVRFLKPLNNVLSVPLLLVGLNAPRIFHIATQRIGGKRVGTVVMNQPIEP